MSSSYDRMLEVFNEYRLGVNAAIWQTRAKPILEGIVLVVVPAAAAVGSVLLGSTAAVVVALGLGSVNAGQTIAKSDSIIADYYSADNMSNRKKLRSSVIAFRMRIKACEPSHEMTIKRITQDMIDQAKAL